MEATWSRHATEAPSRVFASGTALYPGRPLSRDEMVAELRSLGYRASDGAPTEPLASGEYRLGADRLVVHLHDFRYPPPRGLFRGFPLRVTFADGRIGRMRDLASGRAVTDVELEPRQVATLLDARRVRRDPVRLEDVPAVLTQAVLAVEDREFFDHHGLDLSRVAGAAWANLRAGRLAQGGSTITQQLVKNYYLTPDRSFARKIREAAMAVVLESTRDKREILEAYLNTVYLGRTGTSGIVGVAEASEHYFGRRVSRLGLAESALLAGMIRAPNRYAPTRHPDAARRRRDLVLRLMERQGRITGAERERAEARPVPSRGGDGPAATAARADWFVDLVQRELQDRFSREDLRREDLRIFTTLDLRAQAAADSAVRAGLAALEEAHPRLRTRAGREDGSSGPGDGASPLQAALVALDPRTGDVLALVGGRSYRTSPFNRAVRARRQPGSLFKPFVYLAALADTAGRWTLASRIQDTSFTVEAGGRRWSPSNYDGEEHGRVTLRRALEESHNVATARLATEVGLDRVVATARRLGLSADLRPVPSLALGTIEVTPLEMASAYASLAGGGVRPEPLSVLRVTGPDGEAVEARELSMERVAPSGPVHLVNRALQGVLEEGTASRAEELGYGGPAAGKTGTTSGYRDAWFVGYTPEIVALVWVGFDDNRPLRLTGAEAALPLWVRFMQRYGAGGAADFRTPEGVVEAAVERPDGDGGTACRPEYFLEGSEPEEECGDGWWIF
jgi:penicillin-binding protein 1B